MTTIMQGWPRTVRNGKVRELCYKLKVSAGDSLDLLNAFEVQCTTNHKVKADKVVFTESDTNCFCKLLCK